ncbi:hypothetical protein SNEBB_001317 [Seison nebaliae]|nr:hypothetical protein SNEBB_001317 [Seison nebaliae]
MTISFDIEKVHENRTGWGPSKPFVLYQDMPYQPFSKHDRLGKVADWVQSNFTEKRYQNRYQTQQSMVSHYAYMPAQEDNEYVLQEFRDARQPNQRGYRFRFNHHHNYRNYRNNHNRYHNSHYQPITKSTISTLSKYDKQRLNNMKKMQKAKAAVQPTHSKREPSTPIHEDWVSLHEFEFKQLDVLRIEKLPAVKTLRSCGSLNFYDKSFQRNVPIQLKKGDKSLVRKTTSFDDVIRDLSKQHGNVFIVDWLLATIMCCTKSVFPWHIKVTKVKDKLFFDYDDKEMVTVNETAPDAPNDVVSKNLSLEALFIDINFRQQVLMKNENDSIKMENADPFMDALKKDNVKMECLPTAYRYRLFDLGFKNIKVLVRCEQDAVMKTENKDSLQYINLRALNEHVRPNVPDWRVRLKQSTAGTLATEIKNNANKFAKWVVSASVAGSDLLKIGLVSPMSGNKTPSYEVLDIHTVNLKAEDSGQFNINININNGWAVFQSLVELIFAQPHEFASYIIWRDPEKNVIRIFHRDRPSSSSSEESENDDDDDDDDDNDDDNDNNDDDEEKEEEEEENDVGKEKKEEEKKELKEEKEEEKK